MSGTIPLQEARRLVGSQVPRPTEVEVESVPLDASLGRRLAKDVHADAPWPTTDRSAMDGFAVYAGAGGLAQGAKLTVVGESLAGKPFAGRLRAGQAVRIMTGGVVPPGADAVVMVEQTSGFGDEGDERDGSHGSGGGGREVVLRAAVPRGANIRPQGSEVEAGALVLGTGARLGAAEIGVLAVLGIDPVPCWARPKVAVLATGDEVVPIRRVPLAHQVRDSNAHALAAQVRAAGGEPLPLGIAADRREAMHAALAQGLAHADVLLTIGGVSKGTHDLVDGVLRELGVREVFHGIALKPGKPTFFGVASVPAAGGTATTTATTAAAGGGAVRRVLVFGLPGNPASCTTVFDLLVAPVLAQLGGAAPPPVVRAWLAGTPFRRNARLQAVPARLAAGGDGELLAVLAKPSPSGDPFGLTAADGYALIPPDSEPDTLTTIEFVPFAGGWPQA